MEPSKPSELVVVIPEPIERQLIELSNGVSGAETHAWPECTGIFRTDEGHIRLEAPSDILYPSSISLCRHIPCFVGHKPIGSISFDSLPESNNWESPSLLLIASPESTGSITAYYVEPGDKSIPATTTPCTVILLGDRLGLFDRISPVVNLSKLQDKKVAVIGLGSGGGFGAVELAKSGIGSLILVDYDRLEITNVSRHVCGLLDIGRWKTRAVKDKILQHNPDTDIACHEVDITEQPELLESIVDSVDMVFVATDNEISKYLINEQCVYQHVPAVYGGVYERAFAGEVVLVMPDRGGCYSCVRQNLARTPGIVSATVAGEYADDVDTPHEPGLGIDVGFIANLQVKIAVSGLLDDRVPAFNDPGDQMIIWVNSARPQDGPLFGSSLSRYFVKVPRLPDCRTCGVLTNFEEPEDPAHE